MTVLTVITRKTGAVPLARFGYSVARALEKKLVVLCAEGGVGNEEPIVLVPGGEVPENASEIVVAICEDLTHDTFEELTDPGEEASESERILPAPEVELRWLRTTRRLQAVLGQIKAVQADFLIAAKHEPRPRNVALARKLFTAAPCHTVLVRLGESEKTRCRRILVPTAGGPHARIALRLASRLASASGGAVVPLYIATDAGELAEEVGVRLLEKAVASAGVVGSASVTPRVELSNDRFQAIQTVAEEGFDLVLLGDSHVGRIRRSLFGTVPDHLLTGEQGLKVAVVRREWKLLHRLRRRLGHWLDVAIPQMARSERVALYEKLQSGSQWNFDFMALIALSTAIAALGLLQNSGAVVIGAMLVAPLMTPILGAGLALVQGNFPLLRTASRAIVLGYLIALLIGLVLGMLFPIPDLTPQLEARGGPTLLDMGVGFLSGIAAAFCLGRPGLLGALPGVAIAAALVPPIATTGVCLALSENAVAGGSALLFGTNVVAIILGAAGSLYAIGVRGKSGASGHQRWVRHVFFVLFLGLAALAVPLSKGLLSQLDGDSVELRASLENRLEQRLVTFADSAFSDCRIQDLVSRREVGERVIEVTVTSPQPLPSDLIADLARIAKEEMGSDRIVRIKTRLAVEMR